MKEIWHIMIAISIVLGTARAQIENQYGKFGTRANQKTGIVSEPTKFNIPTPILEKPIEPKEYVVGPGDIFGININAMENMYFTITVGPTGDLLIPGVGAENISGLILEKAIDILKERISETYQNVRSDISLTNIRTFKVQISGAVNEPNFYLINPVERLSDIIQQADGVHQLAKEFKIEIIRSSGKHNFINFLDYIRYGDLDSNPTFLEGDKIVVPFGEINNEAVVLRGSVLGSGYDIIEPNENLESFLNRRVKFNTDADLESVVITRKVNGENTYLRVSPKDFSSTKIQAGDTIDILREKGVMVNGFILSPGSFGFFPGYLSADYISMAGGNTINGDPNRCIVKHRDRTIEVGLNVIIRRGDIIVIPRTMKDSIIGDISLLQIIVSIATITLSYLASIS